MTSAAEDLVPGPACPLVGSQALELHVEVTYLAQHPAQPTELLPVAPRPGGEDGREQVQPGAQPSGGHPHVVQLLGILPEAASRAPSGAAPPAAGG